MPDASGDQLGPLRDWMLENLALPLDLGTLAPAPAEVLVLNDLGRIRLRLAAPVVADRYHEQHEGGRFVLVDDATNDTAAAGMIRSLALTPAN